MAGLRFGIIGTGGFAHRHVENLKSIDGVTITSCYNHRQQRAEEFAVKHEIPHVARDIADLLTQVDAACVITRDAFHVRNGLEVLRGGKHLLCEKPIGVTLAEARELAGAARIAEADGIISMTNFRYRGSSALHEAARMVQSGELGDIRLVQASYLQSWLIADMYGPWTGDSLLWKLQTEAGSGGVLTDLGCHILDIATAVAGTPARFRCSVSNFPKISADGKPVTDHSGKLDANDNAIIETQFTNGAVGIIHVSRWASGHENHIRLEVSGTSGAVRFDLDKSYEDIETCLGREQRDKALWTTRSLPKAPTLWERFVSAIRNRKSDQPDLIRGAQVQAYLDSCQRSALSEHWEPVATTE